MKRYGFLFPKIVSPSNLWGAWLDFRRGKRRRPSVRAFEPIADREVFRLRRALESGTWRPGKFRLMWIQEPKRRLIAAAPVRDRVVHHACNRVLAPRLDRSLVDQTYACLPGRGSHRALLAFQHAQRRYRYVLHLDIRHYFLSIDRRILMQLMERKIKDRRCLELLARIAEGGEGLYSQPEVREKLGLSPDYPPRGCGLPIGNLTSQWWGNHYLSGLDHFVLRTLRIPHYQRYMDDLTLFSSSKAQLEQARQDVRNWLARERGLRLKKPGAAVRSTSRTALYLGHRINRRRIQPGPSMNRKARQRLAGHLARGCAESFQRSMASYRGVLLGPVIPKSAEAS